MCTGDEECVLPCTYAQPPIHSFTSSHPDPDLDVSYEHVLWKAAVTNQGAAGVGRAVARQGAWVYDWAYLICVLCGGGHGLDPHLCVVQGWAWPRPSPVCSAGMGVAYTLTCVFMLFRDGRGLHPHLCVVQRWAWPKHSV